MPSLLKSATASGSDRNDREVAVTREGAVWVGRFRAMANPCEVLLELNDADTARAITESVARCAWRVEDKFSRYRSGNIVHAINTSAGKPVVVDEETANLLDFTATMHELSDGLFDITSGVLRRAWVFDGVARLPTREEVNALLTLVGWHKVVWNRPLLTMLPDMQLDFGGIGKEYAVDQAIAAVRRDFHGSCLVNFGGDLSITQPRESGAAWRVGVESAQGSGARTAALIDLYRGALATSGDTYRFIMSDGRRYTHILDPRTGWPVEHAPRSVTVCAPTCTDAGMLTTMALLRGAGAASFLEEAGVRHWIQD
jgi:thiamine biosynthesis lipoprotein